MIAARQRNEFAEYANVSRNGGGAFAVDVSAGSADSIECIATQRNVSSKTRNASQLPSVRLDEVAIPRANGAAAMRIQAISRETTPVHASARVRFCSAIAGA